MGRQSRTQTQTQENRPPQQLVDFWDFINTNVRPNIGTGALTPMIPMDMQLTAPLPMFGQNAAAALGNYWNSPFFTHGVNYGMGLVQRLGNSMNNPLLQIGQGLGGDIFNTLRGILRGPAAGGELVDPINGIYTMPGGISSGGSSFSYQSTPVGYNPLTNPQIDELIRATEDNVIRAFQRNDLANLRAQAIADGGLGGSRQGIAEGIAQEGLARQLAEIGGNIRFQADNAERNRLAQLAQQQISANASGLNAAANLEAARLGMRSNELLAALNMGQDLLNRGFGYGMQGLQGAGALLPSILNMPLGPMGQAFNVGLGLAGFNQAALDRDLARYMNNAGINAQDLILYSQLMNPGAMSQFGVTRITGPAQRSGGLSGAVGGALGTMGILAQIPGFALAGPLGIGLTALGALAGGLG